MLAHCCHTLLFLPLHCIDRYCSQLLTPNERNALHKREVALVQTTGAMYSFDSVQQQWQLTGSVGLQRRVHPPSPPPSKASSTDI
jgi:hypothetical protein